MLTAHHLFGPAAGLKRPLSGEDLQKRVSEVRGTPLGTSGTVVGGRPVFFADAASMETAQNVFVDVAAFPVEQDGGAPAIPVAREFPNPGDRIRLASQPPRSPELGAGLEGTVLDVTTDYISYRFDVPFDHAGTSGGPIVDAQGRLVAIQLGGSGTDGVGAPAATTLRRLARVESGATGPDLFAGPAVAPPPGTTRIPLADLLAAEQIAPAPWLEGCLALELPGAAPDRGLHAHSLVRGAHQISLSTVDTRVQYTTMDAMLGASVESFPKARPGTTTTPSTLGGAAGATPVFWGMAGSDVMYGIIGRQAEHLISGVVCEGPAATPTRQPFCERAFAHLVQ